jgi:hypothetical protein
LFAVRNGTAQEVSVRYEYRSADGSLLHGEVLPLAGHAVRAVNLRDLGPVVSAAQDGSATGFVRIEALAAPPRTERILGGDFMYVDPLRTLAAGEALVETDPERLPPQLCRRWSVRLLQGGPLGLATTFVFFVNPDEGAEDPAPLATGRVFGEDGGFVAPVQVPGALTALQAFEVAASGLGLEAQLGSVEWEFREEGRRGHISALVSAAGGFSVLLPGICADTLEDQELARQARDGATKP